MSFSKATEVFFQETAVTEEVNASLKWSY